MKLILSINSNKKSEMLRKNNNKQTGTVRLKRLRQQQLKDQRSISIQMRKGITLWGSIRWSIRQRCAVTGNSLESANFKITALSHMEKMNFTKRHTFLLTIKLSSVNNSMQLLSVLTATDASFSILNMIYLRQKILTTP